MPKKPTVVPKESTTNNKITNDQEIDARRTMIEDLFYDIYKSRRRIYRVNFVRGLYFGFGSVLGGTLLVALLIWVLGQFSEQVPFIQNVIDIINSQGN